jgi:hypothetical protein
MVPVPWAARHGASRSVGPPENYAKKPLMDRGLTLQSRQSVAAMAAKLPGTECWGARRSRFEERSRHRGGEARSGRKDARCEGGPAE